MSNVITFRREGCEQWERAYTEDHLKLKLGEDRASHIVRPKKSLFHRIIVLGRYLIRHH
jgi:hypothetical protein